MKRASFFPAWRLMVPVLLAAAPASAGASELVWREDFRTPAAIREVGAMEGGGWSWYSGDGDAEIDLVGGDGYASVRIDATEDSLNIWWAVIRRRLDPLIDVAALAREDRELRVEVRVRPSHAPRRINLHFNTSRTDDFHSHLREYDLGEAGEWHRLSMTTRDFPVAVGDAIFMQLALMDWGRETYQLDIDYVEVSIVDLKQSGPDLGDPQVYHPPVPEASTLGHEEVATADTTLDAAFPDLNLNAWGQAAEGRALLPLTATQTPLLRWDFSALTGRQAEGLAVLTLTTESVHRMFGTFEEIGRIRVIEVLDGPSDWAEDQVTYDRFTEGQPLASVLNGQMIIDVELDPEPGAVNRIPIPRSVMQRLLDGRTHSVALRPLGPINAVVRAREGDPASAPRLAFNLVDD